MLGSNQRERRPRLSPSLIISLIALVVAMSSGAYAVSQAPKNSVTSKSIKNGQVKTKDLAGNAVDANKVVDGSLGTGDLSDAAKAALRDATTLGGMSIAQLVAAAGGEYVEARQAAGATNIKVLPANGVTLVTLNLPHAGKWLVDAQIPVEGVYDGSDGANPANPNPAEPFFPALGRMLVGGTITDSQETSCEAEAGVVAVLVPIWKGTGLVHISRMVTTTGPTAVVLKASGAASNVVGVDVVPGQRITSTASGALIQAVTVH